MPKNISKHKATKKLTNVEPQEKIPMPFNGVTVKEDGFSFSFACFDRSHKLFNLGGNAKDSTVGGKWFIELLDCLKSVSGKTIAELMNSTHDLHRVDWDNANAKCPSKQAEWWQFRINKSKGRVIGLLIDSVFYVVWLDPYHNLTNSEGYGGVQKFPSPKLT